MSSLFIREFPHLTNKCFSLQQDRLEKALSYANQNYEKMKSTLPVQQQQQQHHQPPQKPTDSTSSSSSNSDNSSLHSSISLLSRVYVGNIHFDIKEPELASIFRQFGGIKGINLSYESTGGGGGANHHKGFGFVEFDNTEAPVIAIAQMEGVFCAGRALKMGRPSNFPKEFPTSIPSPSANSIYLTNIHEDVKRQDLEELAQSIGKVKRIILPVIATTNLLQENSFFTKHKSYSWIEFQEPRAAKRAIRLLNGQFLGGQKLYACACTTDLFKQVNESTSSHDLWSSLNVDDDDNAAKKRVFSPLSIRDAPIIALKGLCMAHEMQMMTKEEQEVFYRDVAEECAKYGELAEELKWFVDDRPEFFNQVHFFVRYSTSEQADYAMARMNGRFFGGRSVQVVKYPLIRFEIGDFYLT